MIIPTRPSLRAEVSGAGSAPPAWADVHHVLQGCLISSVAYLARFRAAFPAERGELLTVDVKGFDGGHTVALVSWRGWWWGRDEFFGVFPLDRRVDKYPHPPRLSARTGAVLEKFAADEVAAGRANWAPRPPRKLPPDERARHVVAAMTHLPIVSEMYWVQCERDEIPVLFFRPAPKLICVYDPMIGTAQAESSQTQPLKLVKAFLEQLGYPVLSVRADLSHAVGARVAALMTSHEGLPP